MVVDDKPYREINNSDGTVVRTFESSVLHEELAWHRDHYDRLVTVLSGSGWQFQFEDGLPVELTEGDKIWIPAGTYHRIKRGTDSLVVQIKEYKNENNKATSKTNS